MDINNSNKINVILGAIINKCTPDVSLSSAELIKMMLHLEHVYKILYEERMGLDETSFEQTYV